MRMSMTGKRISQRVRVNRCICTLLVIVFSCCGCCTRFDSATEKQNNAAQEWIHRWKDSGAWEQIFQWTEIKDSSMAQAETLLREKSFVSLTDSQTAAVVKALPDKISPGRLPFLLRAVGTVDGKFPLELYSRPNGEVWVGGGANSRCPVPMRRRAVVAWLDKPPQEVYVTFVVGK